MNFLLGKGTIMSRDNNGKATPPRANMKDAKRRQGLPAGGAAAVSASGIAIVVFALMPLLAFAAVPPGRGSAQQNPRFASVQIEIWPEFDRPAALVMLKGELPAELALPAAVSLRIPSSSGGATAVAFATAARAELFNLQYEYDWKAAEDYMTLRFQAPERFFQVEFYDPLVTRAPDRSYTFVWPGDLAVDRLSVRFQEPAAASNISVQPDLGAGVAGPDGVRYRTAELGAFKAGKPLPIKIRYTKTDSRTSSEILGLNAPDATPPATTGSSRGLPGWILGLASAVALSMGAVGGVLWWRRRGKASRAQPGGAGFCPQCGSRLASGDRFCSKCGTRVRERNLSDLDRTNS